MKSDLDYWTELDRHKERVLKRIKREEELNAKLKHKKEDKQNGYRTTLSSETLSRTSQDA